jgi:hypothetical protein
VRSALILVLTIAAALLAWATCEHKNDRLIHHRSRHVNRTPLADIPPLKGPATLRIQVRDAAGAPVPESWVVARWKWGDRVSWTVTGEQGIAEPLLDAGLFWIRAVHGDLASAPFLTLPLAHGERHDYQLLLEPARVIRGSVRLPDGSTPAKANVTIRYRDGPESRREFRSSDLLGRFEFPPIPLRLLDPVFVEVRVPDLPRCRFDFTREEIEIQPTLDLRLSVRVVQIEVENAAGAPVANAGIYAVDPLDPMERVGEFRGRTDAMGRARFTVQGPDLPMLLVWHEDYAQRIEEYTPGKPLRLKRGERVRLRCPEVWAVSLHSTLYGTTLDFAVAAREFVFEHVDSDEHFVRLEPNCLGPAVPFAVYDPKGLIEVDMPEPLPLTIRFRNEYGGAPVAAQRVSIEVRQDEGGVLLRHTFHEREPIESIRIHVWPGPTYGVWVMTALHEPAHLRATAGSYELRMTRRREAR